MISESILGLIPLIVTVLVRHNSYVLQLILKTMLFQVYNKFSLRKIRTYKVEPKYVLLNSFQKNLKPDLDKWKAYLLFPFVSKNLVSQ